MRVAAITALLVTTEALARGASAAMYATAGLSNDDPTQSALISMYRDRARGEDAYADLDAITAALEMTGGVGEDAIFAWGAFDDMGQAYEDYVHNMPP